MKVFKYLSSSLVIGSFAAVLIGFPLAANAEGGAERLKALHGERSVHRKNLVSQPAIYVDKAVDHSITKDGSDNIRKFRKARKAPYPKARGR
ncbi:hypothetical protein [Halopseudomonas pelagia]|uniref:Uncharacterized protein n=1 Tax=Halopseudomonas pelagia TaxID=553151 RepID=A0AA91Z4I1_9GAMM|nr:hypothetical protein [Halopseudomonas pelagia]PCC97907.1 hypothetical protein CO192_18530 [Halopseudomonas pelagia]QFY56172.1 hypothetical protein EAO82_07220 [Halopseudomonas pelagia]